MKNAKRRLGDMYERCRSWGVKEEKWQKALNWVLGEEGEGEC